MEKGEEYEWLDQGRNLAWHLYGASGRAQAGNLLSADFGCAEGRRHVQSRRISPVLAMSKGRHSASHGAARSPCHGSIPA